jgi:phospholipid/cholesterol/gamma-HCH transport system substrate-binding protein
MPSKTHDFTVTEIKAGILVIVSLVILVGFVAAIRGCRPRDDSAKTYHATFSDIGGLNRGADVRFGGVKVGRVAAIEPDPRDWSRIRVTARVRGDVPVNHGSVASIEQVTLTTEKHLEISTGDGGQPLHVSGDTLATRAAGGFLDMPDLEGVAQRLEAALDSVVSLLGVERAREQSADGEPELVDVARLFGSLDTTLDQGRLAVEGVNTVIEENRAGLQEVVTRLIALEVAATELVGRLDTVIEENRQPLHSSAVNLERLTTEMSQSVEEMSATLERTLQYLEDLGGNTSDLVEGQRPTIDEILLNLQETTRNLKEFSRTLAERPESMIRGKGAQGRKSGGMK